MNTCKVLILREMWLLLCLRLLQGMVAMCDKKFLHRVLWHSLAKLWMKTMKIFLYL